MQRDWNKKLKVYDIFVSIQGESSTAGLPCLFIRLYGCNLRCSYCDTPQFSKKVRNMSIGQIREEVKNKIRKSKCSGIRHICITGGEPLIQDNVYPLIFDLITDGYIISVETNGCVPIEFTSRSGAYRYVMDIKCPSSGFSDKNCYDNLKKLEARDEVKFVIADRKDYEFAREVLKNYGTNANIIFSPMFSTKNKAVIGNELVKWVLEDNLSFVRIQVQLHKILGVK